MVHWIVDSWFFLPGTDEKKNVVDYHGTHSIAGVVFQFLLNFPASHQFQQQVSTGTVQLSPVSGGFCGIRITIRVRINRETLPSQN